jgi:hypothetical protein
MTTALIKMFSMEIQKENLCNLRRLGVNTFMPKPSGAGIRTRRSGEVPS